MENKRKSESVYSIILQFRKNKMLVIFCLWFKLSKYIETFYFFSIDVDISSYKIIKKVPTIESSVKAKKIRYG